MLLEMEEYKDRLIETLIRGRDSAQRLQSFLQLRMNVDGSVPVKDLLAEILESFSGGLSMLNYTDSGEISRVPASPMVFQVPDVCTGKKPAPVVKERRGCYKRRRTVDSRVKISTTMEDGYAWRKYGQKEILNSKFPRCYFRCTHKHFHGCKAVKQVQKLEEGESNMFHITYFGKHTCPSPDSLSHQHYEVVLNLEDSKNNNLLPNSPSTITNIHTCVKQEVESKAQSTDVSDNISSGNDDQSSSAIRWNEVLRADLGSCHEGASFMRFDLEDSSASTSSHGYLNMDFHFLNNGDFLSDIIQFDGVFS
ncbi:putative transcription factor WRKY family [Helianthus annuus]|nr:putative transcription factor WRKY family [Helianthus annuus]